MGNKIKMLNGNEIRKHYDVKEKLGAGAFATVKRAVKKSSGEEYAIKIIKKTKLNNEELAVVHDEVEIMHKITHPHCVQLYEMFETKKKLYMVMELLKGGELFDRIIAKESYSESEASSAVKAIAKAIQYLHSIGIVHRDLKPENLIYDSASDDANIKITDFGLAKFREGDASASMNTPCGTPGYVAPEVLKNERYGPEVDMWSLGVILYILLCGFPPFYHESTTQLYKQIKKGEYDFPEAYWSEISDHAKALVRGLLTVDPKKRMTPKQVLEHPWVAGAGVASTKTFDKGHNNRFRTLQARRVMRRGVRSIIAVNRFAHALHEIILRDAAEEAKQSAE
jgi:calcium/calmodulin-dependent protein kinase I